VFHHLGAFASDFTASRAFYAAALEPLGIVAGYEIRSGRRVLARGQ
jgi:catechol 2,3-dioxygenase-like lactoylglutathione lyase family enzyme